MAQIKVEGVFAEVKDSFLTELSDRKWKVKHLCGHKHICRIANTGQGKKFVIMAQDVLGMLCKVHFVDGNTKNCHPENLKPIAKEQLFFYE